MIKTLAQFESTVEGKVGRFLLDHDTAISTAKQMVCEFLTYLVNIEAQGKAAAEAAAAAAEPVAEAAKPESPKIEALEQPPQEVSNV